MVTVCDVTEVTVTFDASDVSDMDTSLLHAGVDPTVTVCQASEATGVITLQFGLDDCDGSVVVRLQFIFWQQSQFSLINEKDHMYD